MPMQAQISVKIVMQPAPYAPQASATRVLNATLATITPQRLLHVLRAVQMAIMQTLQHKRATLALDVPPALERLRLV
jgi:hypothetical protein